MTPYCADYVSVRWSGNLAVLAPALPDAWTLHLTANDAAAGLVGGRGQRARRAPYCQRAPRRPHDGYLFDLRVEYREIQGANRVRLEASEPSFFSVVLLTFCGRPRTLWARPLPWRWCPARQTTPTAAPAARA